MDIEIEARTFKAKSEDLLGEPLLQAEMVENRSDQPPAAGADSSWTWTMGDTAEISPCGKYRYTLTRELTEQTMPVRGAAVFIMLNPSTADAFKDDPTIRRCRSFAASWGCTELRVVNLFAWRAKDPKELKVAGDPIGPENNFYIKQMTMGADIIVAAWGAHPMAEKRGKEVLEGLRAAGGRVVVDHLGDLTLAGHPRHPLYLGKDVRRSNGDIYGVPARVEGLSGPPLEHPRYVFPAILPPNSGDIAKLQWGNDWGQSVELNADDFKLT